jgi:hypothetical protein
MRLPRFFRIRIVKYFLLPSAILALAVFVILPYASKRIGNYFSKNCREYSQASFSRKLTDKIPDYSEHARRTGIKECRNEAELKLRVGEGQLSKVSGGRGYTVEKLTHSYPYLTGPGKDLLEEIGRRFRAKTDKAGIAGAEVLVTSLTRTREKVSNLRRNNSNASPNSPHLFGNAFDITYVRFKCRKLNVTPCDTRFMKEALAEIIWELRKEKKCWATYERAQSCYHIVAR